MQLLRLLVASLRQLLDLGAGTGVTSLCAAALGASVLATEVPDALPMLAHNVAQNYERVQAFTASCTPRAGVNNGRGSAIYAAPLPWSLHLPTEGLPLLPPYDVIVAADTLYHTASHALLAATIKNCAAEASIVLLAFPLRTGKVRGDCAT